MYTAKYDITIEKKPFSQQKATAELNVSFRFGHEVSFVDRSKLRDRFGYDSLANYFQESEGLQETRRNSSEGFSSDYSDKKRNIRVNQCIVRLGFDVKVTSDEPMHLEEMLDLDSLNQFILTGNINQNNRKKEI